MTTKQLFAQECKEQQRKYMLWAFLEKGRCHEARTLCVKLALLNRKQARQWKSV